MKTIIYGAPFSGKTWLTGNTDSGLYLDLEGMSRSKKYTDRLKNMRVVAIDSFQSAISALHNAKEKKVVIDSISLLMDWIDIDAAAAGTAYGKHFTVAAQKRAELTKELSKFDRVFFLAHEKTKAVGQDEVPTPKIPESIGNFADVILRTTLVGSKRFVTIDKDRFDVLTEIIPLFRPIDVESLKQDFWLALFGQTITGAPVVFPVQGNPLPQENQIAVAVDPPKVNLSKLVENAKLNLEKDQTNKSEQKAEPVEQKATVEEMMTEKDDEEPKVDPREELKKKIEEIKNRGAK